MLLTYGESMLQPRLAPGDSNSSASGRHILITGTSTGIGRSCAIQLARQGFAVWAGVRTAADAMSLEKAGRDTPHGIRSIQLDVTDMPTIRAAAEEIRDATGKHGLCGIVNNAGVCLVGPVEFTSLKDWRDEFDVNLFGVIAVTQAMLPLLRVHTARNGNWASRIVNIGSITGAISTPLFSAYSASKFALRAMNDALRLELWSEAIHVCLIVPGTIQSEIWRKEKQCVDAIVPGSPARQVYGTLIDNVAGYVFKCAKKAIPAEQVAGAVQRCFTTAKPKIQYRVGWEATVGSRAKTIIPDRLFDFLLGRTLGVPKRSQPPATVSPPNTAKPWPKP